MLRKSKKSLAILLTLMMLATMLVGVPAASAASSSVVTTTPTVTQNVGPAALGSVWVYENADQANSVFQNATSYFVTVTLLSSGVDFVAAPAAGNAPPALAAPLASLGANNKIQVVAGPPIVSDLQILPGATTKTYTLQINPSNVASGQSGFQLNFPVTIAGANVGPIEVEISSPDSGITSGKYTIGYVAQAGTSAVSLDAAQVAQVGQTAVAGPPAVNRLGLIRVEESVVDGLVVGDSIRVDLPANMNWNALTAVTVTGGAIDNPLTVPVETATIATNTAGFSRLTIPIGAVLVGAPRMQITIDPYIDLDDNAEVGDITATVTGTSSRVTTQNLVIGTAGEFGATVQAVGDPKTIVAGALDAEIGSLKIVESAPGSLINARNVSIELPSYVRWFSSEPTVTVDKGNGNLTPNPAAPGTSDDQRHIKKFTVTGSTTASTIEIERMRVYVDADAPEGDVVAKIYGTAGLEGELVLAKVVKPVTVTGGNSKVVIGMANQAASDLTITEGIKSAAHGNPTIINYTAGAEPTKTRLGSSANNPGFIVIDAPNGVTFADVPTVEVTEGNIKLENESVKLINNDNQVQIRVSNASTVPATIKVSDIKLTLDRTVPEGDLKLGITGAAFDRTSDGNDTNVATAVVANVATPAPGDETANAKFVIGDTKYTVNGVEYVMDVAPYIANDRTFMPIRYVAMSLGVIEDNIIWDDAIKTATLIKGDKIVQVKVGSTALLVNGVTITMDVAPEIKDGRTMLPLRFIAQALGASVSWDDTTKTASFSL